MGGTRDGKGLLRGSRRPGSPASAGPTAPAGAVPAGLPLVALACALAWAFLARFSGLLVPSGRAVEASGAMSACAMAVLACAAAATPTLARAVRSGRGVALTGACSAACAAVATVLPYLVPSGGPQDPCTLLSVAVGLATGLAFAGASAVALRAYPFVGSRRALSLVAAAAVFAFALYLAAVGLPAGALLAVSVALPCLAAATLACCAVRAGAPRRGRAGSPEACAAPGEGGSPGGRGTGRLFDLFLVLVGSMVVYMPTMYPKSTNLAPWVFEEGACLGVASWNCVAALALLVALLVLAAAVVGRGRRSAGPAAAAALVGLVLFAAIFSFLPSMSSSALPFVLVTGCSILFALFALAMLVWRARRGGGAYLAVLRRGLAVFSASGLCTAVFALVFLGPLYGTTTFQDVLFALIPAVLLVAALFVAYLMRDDCAGLFGELLGTSAGAPAPKVDTTTMDQRCAETSARCGLTPRESEVLALLAEGRNEPYIEEALGVSRATVKTHITHVYRKVGVASRQQLLDYLHGDGPTG